VTQELLEKFEAKDQARLGEGLHRFAAELYPICRSITGDGIRETLTQIGKRIPLQVSEVPTGTPVFDWTVPKEWNIRDAYIKDGQGRRVVDFQKNNLHVVSYSTPVHAMLSLEELRPHLHSLKDYPDRIPYRTTYYREDWGFCVAHNELKMLEMGQYEVCIDSSLCDGSLSYGECLLPGRMGEEILISCHICHPSLANDNLSGLTVATALAEILSRRALGHSYRFLFIPGTIGAITWLARNPAVVERIRYGLVLTGIGDEGGFHYKKSRRGETGIDRAVTNILKHCGENSEILEFTPYGYDERQYCSPGFNLAVGCLMRSVWGTYSEYHTSADNLRFIRAEKLAQSLQVCLGVVDVLENDRSYRNLSPFCEPQLGKRNLYRTTGGESPDAEITARLWVLNLSDGEHSLLDIAERSGLPFHTICNAAEVLCQGGLLAAISKSETAGQSLET
jgi:aminopeptidase-like protein